MASKKPIGLPTLSKELEESFEVIRKNLKKTTVEWNELRERMASVSTTWFKTWEDMTKMPDGEFNEAIADIQKGLAGCEKAIKELSEIIRKR